MKRNILVGITIICAFCLMAATMVVNAPQLFRQNVTFAGNVFTTVGKGTPGTSVTATEYGNGIFHKTKLHVSSLSISMDDVSEASSSGSKLLYTFPAGSIEILGALVNMTVTKSGAGISTTADGDIALGTAVANTTSTLTGTEADIVASTEVPQMASSVSTLKAAKAAASFHDGTSTSKKVYLNLLVDDADSTADAAQIVTGDVYLYWLNQGDY